MEITKQVPIVANLVLQLDLISSHMNMGLERNINPSHKVTIEACQMTEMNLMKLKMSRRETLIKLEQILSIVVLMMARMMRQMTVNMRNISNCLQKRLIFEKPLSSKRVRITL
jgi:hypothetical protein